MARIMLVWSKIVASDYFLAFHVESSACYKSSFFNADILSFMSLWILVSCLSLPFCAFCCSVYSFCLKMGDNSHAVHPVRYAFTPASAATMPSKPLILCTSRRICPLMARKHASRETFFDYHHAANSSFDLSSAETCTASPQPCDCAVNEGIEREAWLLCEKY
jgi:hypothetical protein